MVMQGTRKRKIQLENRDDVEWKQDSCDGNMEIRKYRKCQQKY